MHEKIASGGASARALVQQNISAAYAEMDKIKENMHRLGSGDGDFDMPDFKPNDQKTKSFFKRLEYGFDIDFDRKNALLPATAKASATIGYKMHDHFVAGAGMGYRVGWGSLEHIELSHQGIGLKSYFDWKAPLGEGSKSLFKNVWISGGYEMDYMNGFKKVNELKNYDLWQRSVLIGLSRKYALGKKVKGEVKLLYDFLHNAQKPAGDAIKFRLGYKF